MRIAHVTDCYLPRMGGIERQVHGLATAQLAAGHDVTVLTSVPAGSPDGADSTDGIPVLRPAGAGSRPGAIRYQASLRGRQVAAGYDLVHVHLSTFSPLAFTAAAAARRAGVPTVATVHSLWSYATPIFRGSDAALGWRSWPLAWTAVSSVAAQELARVLRPGTEISVLANGVRPELWQLPARGPRAQDRVGIVSVMRLAARKRPMQLLRVLRAVRDQVPAGIALEVRIIGDGPQREAMQDYLRRHRMTGWVELTGQLDQPAIRDRFADADLYVSPAVLESFGIAALEARCAGLPVLAFAGTGVADFVTDGRDGVLVGSDGQLVAELARLACSPAARAELAGYQQGGPGSQQGGPGSQQGGSGYRWEEVLATCEQVYRRAFAQSGRPVLEPVPAVRSR
ncbi:glycosyltransferase family 4 protein [Jatrophihabitans sp.]|uniref:glycosyltransferase family 4 protein n=1 Tax=Jatrophihabitans sp. TaxID=1932789 RepID=UPI002CB1053C|nr:glycosyltransferase family 4 protein [Jatrophihabitans sp.]